MPHWGQNRPGCDANSSCVFHCQNAKDCCDNWLVIATASTWLTDNHQWHCLGVCINHCLIFSHWIQKNNTIMSRLVFTSQNNGSFVDWLCWMYSQWSSIEQLPVHQQNFAVDCHFHWKWWGWIFQKKITFMLPRQQLIFNCINYFTTENSTVKISRGHDSPENCPLTQKV